ncbi:TetR/AcrR family transcriptional regulator [Salinibacterium soli]|uniref:TetR/AcrR family transcriptional regulator n=1 Tax=Antiquaquibacter soli TaxID=3064523 RepID=A0ABT9BQX2_9MICO|nr:TetR/AcrR family transcriptional regulator [Protaetiibacter sp. WY-16]MDO7882818.1 TetR/AcrR family transcriptional regulator [Protaetiibacter sp. WY-16]
MDERGSVRVRRETGWKIERYPQTVAGARDERPDLKAQLLRSALEIALREGLEPVTLDAVAAAEGVTPTAVVERFGSREGLMLALLDSVLARTLNADRDLGESDSGRRGLGEMLVAEMEGLRRQAPVVELIFMFYFARRDDVYRRRIREALSNYRRSFEAALDESDARRGVDARVLSSIVLSFLQGAAVQIIRDPDNFAPDDAIAAVRALLP